MMAAERVNECIVCGSTKKSGRYWLCKPCAIEWECYRMPFKKWPEWIKELKRIEDRRMKRGRKYGEEVSLQPDHVIMLIESGKTRP